MAVLSIEADALKRKKYERKKKPTRDGMWRDGEMDSINSRKVSQCRIKMKFRFISYQREHFSWLVEIIVSPA